MSAELTINCTPLDQSDSLIFSRHLIRSKSWGVATCTVLPPYLFAIILDYVMRKTYNGSEEDLGFKLNRQRSRRHQGVTVTDLDSADDLALLTEEIRLNRPSRNFNRYLFAMNALVQGKKRYAKHRKY